MIDPAMWAGRRVFLTGHTGFKGSWLALWLRQMGAQVTGYALPAEEVSLFRQARVGELVHHIEGDIRDLAATEAAMTAARPDVVFHLAAQPLVRLSYAAPVETFATNVQGTVHVLDACRRQPDLRGIICVTSDKCYENREWVWPYRETDPMGGHDPYSSSKGAAELVIAAWRRSFFHGAGAPLLASVRAGNVIGGGDWAADRLVPDVMRALIAGERPLIRNPHAIRPWQHVLEALGGYLMIAQRLLAGDTALAEAWNFGPAEDDTRPVDWIADRLVAGWTGAELTPDPADRGWDRGSSAGAVHEAGVLKLDCAKARTALGWRPAMALDATLDAIVAWYGAVAQGGDARAITLEQIARYHARLTGQAAAS